MEVWAVEYNPPQFTDQLYYKALELLDHESQTKIKKYYHRKDACRALVSKLLPRLLLLRNHGISPSEMRFDKTEANKPYIVTETVRSKIAYNISHDNDFIVMAFSERGPIPPAIPGVHPTANEAGSIGIDVMKVALPGRHDTYSSFVRIFQEQLTPLERNLLLAPPINPALGLENFFWIWTLKEAYTKALGIGLGFDFSRVEFDLTSAAMQGNGESKRKGDGGGIVRVDGKIPKGWKFTKFTRRVQRGEENKEDFYVGVVAEYLGEDFDTIVVPHSLTEDTRETNDATDEDRDGEYSWLKHLHATVFVQDAIRELHSSPSSS
ncbi:4'-phosphopantetheinyl transferase [Dendrothele bispora CBS 962.96]|uniref:holo-[acyl-carrier-protein] synthase n=1 Tax=Dendrothele bispora (strain CBS 962.96) TaxID=1314807 RepID=A0A4S8LT44_DENBC|nr:4'-phosphopantetheinyl transferase [Dendrothele bispora CBS 962.96]